MCYPIFIIISTDLGEAAAVCVCVQVCGETEKVREEAVEKEEGKRGGRCSIVCFFAEKESERVKKKYKKTLQINRRVYLDSIIRVL